MPSLSTHKLICENVQTGIRALSLSGLTSTNVRVLWGIDPEQTNFPAVFVCAAGSLSVVGGTNGRDDIAYPVAIFICDKNPIEDEQYMDTLLYWRERIRKRFIYQHLSEVVSGGVATVYTCRMSPSVILDENLSRRYQILVEPLLLEFISRETRGAS